jgi:hypothetical protein
MSDLENALQTTCLHDALTAEEAARVFRECWQEATDGAEPRTIKQIMVVLEECHILFCRKHDSYGPGNIAAFGLVGVTVRLSDKVQRLAHLVVGRKTNTLADESIEDTFRDIINYGVIALLIQRGLWPDLETGAQRQGGLWA